MLIKHLLRHRMLRKRFEKWRLPFIKEEIVGLIRNEIKKYEKATADFSLKFSSRIFPNDVTRDYVRGILKGYYIENFEKMIYKKAYSNIIDICDKAFEHIKELCDKNKITTEIEHKYKNIKEISDKQINDTKYYYDDKKKCVEGFDYDNDYNDIDDITMPVIRVLHIEYVKFLDYKRLVKFQQQAKLTEEECISIAYYLMSKNLIYFYLNIDKYPVNTLLVKKIMSKFSKKHGIRPEDTLEIFQEYIGNGEESKKIMDHQTPVYWGDIFL